MYLSAYTNANGVFLIRINSENRRYLRKFTFGKSSMVEVRITAQEADEIADCRSYSASWSLCNKILSGKLAERHANKKLKGNC